MGRVPKSPFFGLDTTEEPNDMKHATTRGTLLAITVLGAIAASTGCATIMAGGPDKVPVTSAPSGATVYVDNQPVGRTPTMIVLDRERSQGHIRVAAAGYEPAILVRSKQINGWFWANLCFGGVIGIVVDLVTGDVKRFDDTGIHVNLAPSRSPGSVPMSSVSTRGAPQRMRSDGSSSQQ